MSDVKSAAGSALDHIIQESTRVLEDGDYIGEDGLVYCGKCNTHKERIIDLPESIYGPGKKKKVHCMCKCEQEAQERRKKKEQYEEEMARIRQMRDASLMDSKYRKATFSNYRIYEQNRKAFRIARAYTDRFPEMLEENQGIIFYGPVGTGKSFTSACIANALLDNKVSVIMTSFVKILQNIQTQDEAAYISMLNSAKLLILDDLGTERNTDYALEKVYNIIDSRSRASKPMVLTTNLTLSEMLEAEDIRYKRIYDRIFETCVPVEVPGESFRRIAAEQRFDKMSKFMEG